MKALGKRGLYPLFRSVPAEMNEKTKSVSGKTTLAREVEMSTAGTGTA